MKIKGQVIKDCDNNITDKICPVCSKNLRYKQACCGQKYSMRVCVCGYKEIVK